MNAPEFTAEAHAMLVRHEAERRASLLRGAPDSFVSALAAVQQAEREQLARTMLALVFPASKRPPVC